MNPSQTTNEPSPLPDAATAMQMMRGALGQLRFARNYTLELLDATPTHHWLAIPDGLPTNIAWQIGHITVSQYGLLMFRMRGRQPEDLDLIPGRFRKAFGRGSTPSDDPATQPSADDLRDRMDAVFHQAMAGLSQLAPEVLLEPVEMPYAAYPIKLGAILFCPLHEQIHAGQIGLLRRALGLESIR